MIEHIRKQGFFVVDTEPRRGESGWPIPKWRRWRVRPDGQARPARRWICRSCADVIRDVESARGPAVKLPTMGGGLPLDSVERPLGTRTIVIPIGNHDNNQHSFDENLRIQNLWDGIELMAALLTM